MACAKMTSNRVVILKGWNHLRRKPTIELENE
jgi:hypothetical protein